MPELMPIRTSLLRDTVHDRLRDAIVDGSLAPGEVLRDGDLADSLGVSRTPVREALLRLGEAGLVRAAPGRSTVVADIDVAEVRDAQSVVAAMHRLAVAEAADRLTAQDLRRMRAANGRFADAIARRDIEAALRADDDFHAVPVEVCANRALATVLGTFTPVVRRLERLRFASVVGVESVELHSRLVTLCEQRDAEAAADVSFQTWQNLAALIDDEPHDRPEESP